MEVKDFTYYKKHPDRFVEEYLGIELKPSQRAQLRMLTLRPDWQDVIQVTRCKDCKWWHREMSKDGITEYVVFSCCDKGLPGDGHHYYCPYGERREV